MIFHVQRLSFLLVPAIALGCGGGGPGDYPDMGSVTGTVTMDDKPLASAIITFSPGDGTRQSTALTDEDGCYELIYSMDVNGAKAGEHTVRISTYKPPGPDMNGDFAAATPDSVPMKYNSKSELKKTVEAGSQTIDFELSSDGEIDPHKEDENVTESDF